MNACWCKDIELTEGAAIHESWQRTFVMSTCTCVVQSVNTLFLSSRVPSTLHIGGYLWWWHTVHTGISRACRSALSHCDVQCLEKSNWSHLIYWRHKSLNLHTCNLPLTDYPNSSACRDKNSIDSFFTRFPFHARTSVHGYIHTFIRCRW